MEIIIIIALLAILAEVTYLVFKQQPNKSKNSDIAIYIDTSVLMDGRIALLAQTGFLGNHLVVLKSVINELQFLADNGDADKRAKARQGLDLVSELQELETVNVEVVQDGPTDEGGVDARLVEMAKKHDGRVCTLDFNLQKVAEVEGVFVLNINALAQSLRMAYLPGEKLSLDIIQKGNDAQQGVGYLADGTMVVVENAAKQIGNSLDIKVVRSLQTAAGRMMFAKPDKPQQTTKRNDKRQSSRKVSKEDSLLELVNKQDS